MKSMERIRRAEADVSLAGSRAANFLGIMLRYGLIPEHHRDQATEIVEAHRSATSKLDDALDLPATSRAREFRVDDIVRRRPGLAEWLKADPETEGRVWEVSHVHPELVNVVWKDGTANGSIHTDNLVRVA